MPMLMLSALPPVSDASGLDKDSRIRLELVSAPDFVKNVTMSPSFAEFILEKDK